MKTRYGFWLRTVVTAAGLAAAMVLSTAGGGLSVHAQTPGKAIGRTPDGKPDFNGVWQALTTAAWDLQDHNAAAGWPAGLSVVENNEIPYKPEMLAKKKANYKDRDKLDPVNKCYLPGVPRITYMPYPFRIAQTPAHIAIMYEYSHAYRMIYMNGTKHPEALEFWMGDSRGRWEGDTLVADVADFNDQTWFDRAGNFHSDALHVVERYTMIGPDHIRYEATIEDSKVFTRPWKISLTLYRRLDPSVRVLDYECLEFMLPHMPWYEVPQGLPKPPGR
jgi:hypothetical protein